MTRSILVLVASLALAFSNPALAQRSHPGGGPPAGHGPGGNSAATGSGSHGSDATMRADMAHSSPSEVLSHNTAIAGKIKTLTGEDAATACNGFKNLGQCVAAAHVAKNLDIPGGFDALRAKMTGTGAVSLGKAIQGLAPSANAKAEAKKANKQADDDMKESETNS
jgi:hypothetical protein